MLKNVFILLELDLGGIFEHRSFLVCLFVLWGERCILCCLLSTKKELSFTDFQSIKIELSRFIPGLRYFGKSISPQLRLYITFVDTRKLGQLRNWIIMLNKKHTAHAKSVFRIFKASKLNYPDSFQGWNTSQRVVCVNYHALFFPGCENGTAACLKTGLDVLHRNGYKPVSETNILVAA